jgi:outer membrane protein
MNATNFARLSAGLSLVAILLTGVLLMLHFQNKNGNSNNDLPEILQTRDTTVSMPGNLSFAYVNTDSLMKHYMFYQDAIKKIEAYEKQLQTQFESKARKLQQDYDSYVANAKAGTIPLQQQKETEARLTTQQQELAELEQRLTQESALKRQETSNQVSETILSFLEEYRVEYNYTFIFQHGSMSGLLAATPQLDITDVIIKRLNAKYEFENRK